MPPVGFLCLVALAAAHLYQIWKKGPGDASSPWDRAHDTKGLAQWRAKKDALRRIAHGCEMPFEPYIVRLPIKDRVILSMPVSLYESRSRKRPVVLRRQADQSLTWDHPAGSGKSVNIALTDRGVLELTEERFIFKSARQRREFPLGELTHFSVTSSRLAIAAHGREYGISYFKGIGEVRLQAHVEPGPGDTWPAEDISFAVHGADISEIVRWLTPLPPSPEPA
jgi:hypothetical protein